MDHPVDPAAVAAFHTALTWPDFALKRTRKCKGGGSLTRSVRSMKEIGMRHAILRHGAAQRLLDPFLPYDLIP